MHILAVCWFGVALQAVDSVSLEPVDSVTQPVVFAVAAKFGSVRLIDNMEMFPAA